MASASASVIASLVALLTTFVVATVITSVVTAVAALVTSALTAVVTAVRFLENQRIVKGPILLRKSDQHKKGLLGSKQPHLPDLNELAQAASQRRAEDRAARL
jgi:hypothetical protein